MAVQGEAFRSVWSWWPVRPEVEKTAKSWKRLIPDNLLGATAQAGRLQYTTRGIARVVSEIRVEKAADSLRTDTFSFGHGENAVYARNGKLFDGTAGPANFEFVDFGGSSQAEMDT